MEFDLAQLIKTVGQYRRDEFVARPIEPTVAQRGDLQRIYMRIVRRWQQAYRETIAPVYERSLSELVTDDADDLTATIAATEAQIAALAAAAGVTLREFVAEIERWHRRRYAQAFTPAGVQIGTLMGAGDVRQTLQAVIAENVSLIRSLNDQMRNGIEGAVFRGLQNRTPAREVASEIRKLAGIGRRRAELIAADQLAKLTSRLDEERQRQSGLSKFKWKHSGKTNYRPEHLARDGKTFEWGKGVGVSDPPGKAIRCGCRAQAIVDLGEA